MSTEDLDNLAAETCAYMTIVHPDYSKLAARIAISNLHKRTYDSFLEVSTRLYTKIKDKIGRPAPISQIYLKLIRFEIISLFECLRTMCTR